MRSQIIRAGAVSLLLLASFGLAGCYEFHLTGPEDPDPVDRPQLVSVTIEYAQLKTCETGAECDEPVVFSGSWMQPGAEFSLVRDDGNRVWRGTAYGVPVNFPPRGEPYRVFVVDPLLRGSETAGRSADRVVVGGESLRRLVYPDTPDEHAVVYIDSNGQGHNLY